VGAYAGFYGGVLRAGVRAAVATLQSVPGVLLVFVAASASDLNRWVITAVVGCILLPDVAAGVQQRVEAFRRSDFVQAATELGLHDATTLWREIVWHNVRGYLIERTAVVFHAAVLMDVTLSYVGLRDGQRVSLGGMLKSGRSSLTSGESAAEAAAALTGVLMVIVMISLLARGCQRMVARSQ
jgi:peptide/nickel transport system permease protein